MDIPDDLPLIFMTINRFDRASKETVRKQYQLEWSKLDREMTIEALRILNSDKSNISPRGFEETVITVSSGSKNTAADILQFRAAFVEITPDELDSIRTDASKRRVGGRFFAAPHGYAEDETGQPISMTEIIECISGRTGIVLRGDTRSVLRLGAVPPSKGAWTTTQANTIAQFLDVVERICSSEWYRNPHSLTSISRKDGSHELKQAIFANDEQTIAVLAYFRQLHAKDKLLAKACKIYCEFVSHPGKAMWVEDVVQHFSDMMNIPPFGRSPVGHSRREIIQMFMYGARLLHSESAFGHDEKLALLIQALGKNDVVLLFNSSLNDILRFATALYHVIRQDFDRWINQNGLAKPDRIAIADLFEGFNAAE